MADIQKDEQKKKTFKKQKVRYSDEMLRDWCSGNMTVFGTVAGGSTPSSLELIRN